MTQRLREGEGEAEGGLLLAGLMRSDSSLSDNSDCEWMRERRFREVLSSRILLSGLK